MDKIIHRVEADVKRNDKKKSLKDIKSLLKADKKFDREIAESKRMKQKGKRGC